MRANAERTHAVMTMIMHPPILTMDENKRRRWKRQSQEEIPAGLMRKPKLFLIVVAFTLLLQLPLSLGAQKLTLADAVKAAEANNRGIRAAELDRAKARYESSIAGTYRWPQFSLIALGTETLQNLGIKFPQGAFGVLPGVGPVPATDTTLKTPGHLAGILFANAAQPMSQQYKIGLQIHEAHIGQQASSEQARLKRQATVNEVRRVYYGILQLESGQKSLQATVDFLKELDHDTDKNVLQRVALQADSLNVKAQLSQAEYELLKLDDPLQTQKQQLNRLMGRDVDTPLEVDPSSATDFVVPQLQEAYAKALESRPEIRLAQLQQQKATLDRKIASAERIPDVSLAFTVFATNVSNALPTHLSGVGIQVTWDIFDWGRKRKTVAEKRLGEEQASLDVKEAKALVMVDVSHQYRRLIEARKELEVTKNLQLAATELLRVTRNRYAQREALLSDALKVQSGLSDADHRYTQALLNLATTMADFEKAIGED